MSASKEYESGSCPFCGSDRADVKAQYNNQSFEDDVHAETVYSVLECRGCGKIYFKSCSTNSEDYHDFYDPISGEEVFEYIERIKFWPPAGKRRQPDWSVEIDSRDTVLGSLFDDVYTALDNNLGVLAAIGMRTVFDRASELLRIDTELSFAKKLAALKDADHITGREQQALQSLVDAGSAAAHRGWRPEAKQLDDMMVILEAFLHRAFVLGDVGERLQKQVPPRKQAKQPAKS